MKARIRATLRQYSSSVPRSDNWPSGINLRSRFLTSWIYYPEYCLARRKICFHFHLGEWTVSLLRHHIGGFFLFLYKFRPFSFGAYFSLRNRQKSFQAIRAEAWIENLKKVRKRLSGWAWRLALFPILGNVFLSVLTTYHIQSDMSFSSPSFCLVIILGGILQFIGMDISTGDESHTPILEHFKNK